MTVTDRLNAGSRSFRIVMLGRGWPSLGPLGVKVMTKVSRSRYRLGKKSRRSL